MEEKVKAPFWKPALSYGVILGLVSVFISLVFYFIGMATVSWTNYVSMLVGIVLLVYLMIQYRNVHLGGSGRICKLWTNICYGACLCGYHCHHYQCNLYLRAFYSY